MLVLVRKFKASHFRKIYIVKDYYKTTLHNYDPKYCDQPAKLGRIERSGDHGFKAATVPPEPSSYNISFGWM